MKVRTKLILLLSLLVFVLVTVFIFSWYVERKTLVLIFEKETDEKKDVFNKLIMLKGQSLETLVYDYTYWDEMVNFIVKEDKGWAEEMIDDNTLSNFSANSIWVCRLDTSLIYSISNLNDTRLQEMALPNEAFSRLFRERFCHFFLNTPKGLMEIRGATVHTTVDAERRNLPRGYFFAGRLWNNDYIAELSALTGSSIAITPVSGKIKFLDTLNPDEGIITFTRILTGWDGKPLMQLRAQVVSEIIKGFNLRYKKYLVTLLIFTVVIIATFAFFTMGWIGIPLYSIPKTLKKGDLRYIDILQKDKTEFGDISRLLDKFFKQRGELLKEISQREKAEQELVNAYQKLKDAQEQLIQSSKMAAMGQLAAGISHELNQPLTGIKGFAESAVMELDDNSPLREDLNKIAEQADRMDKIIRNIRFFARRSEFKMEELDINRPIEDAFMLLNEQLKIRNIRVSKYLGGNLPKIKGDRNQLQQIFLNLITNARDAIDSLKNHNGGEIIARSILSADKKNIEITFDDTGCGIPKEDIENIFNPFFTTKSPDGGIGLGLSIVYRIIENHKGRIEVESLLGRGTTFKIILPIDGEIRS